MRVAVGADAVPRGGVGPGRPRLQRVAGEDDEGALAEAPRVRGEEGVRVAALRDL